MDKNITIRHKTQTGYDTLTPNVDAKGVIFDKDNNLTNDTTQFSNVHNNMWSDNMQDAIVELDNNIAANGRSFEKLHIGANLDPFSTKIATNKTGSQIGILDTTLSYFMGSNDYGQTWNTFYIQSQTYGQALELKFCEATNSFWALTPLSLVELKITSSYISGGHYRPPARVLVTGMIHFDICGYNGKIYIVVGCSEDSSQPIAWVCSATKSNLYGDVANALLWTTLIARESVPDAPNHIKCSTLGWVAVVATVGTNYSTKSYLVRLGSSSTKYTDTWNTYISTLSMAESADGSSNVFALCGDDNTVRCRTVTNASTISSAWTTGQLVCMDANDVELTVKDLIWVNDRWCTIAENTPGKPYFALNPSTSLSLSGSVRFNTVALSDRLPWQYVTAWYNSDMSVLESQGVKQSSAVTCTTIIYQSGRYMIVTSTGLAISVDSGGYTSSLYPPLLIENAFMLYRKIIKGAKDTYMLLGTDAHASLTGNVARSMLSVSVDCETWISCSLSGYEKFTDLVCTHGYYYWAGVDVSSGLAALYSRNIKTKTTQYLTDASYNDFTQPEAEAMISVDTRQVLIAVSNKKPTSASTYCHIYKSLFTTGEFTRQRREPGVYRGFVYSGVQQDHYILRWNYGGYVLAFCATVDGTTLTEHQRTVYANEWDLLQGRFFGRNEVEGAIYMIGKENTVHSIANDNVNFIPLYTPRWLRQGNPVVCPNVNINGYYFMPVADADGVFEYMRYSVTNSMSDSGIVAYECAVPTHGRTSLNSLVSVEDKIFALLGRGYNEETALWMSTTT